MKAGRSRRMPPRLATWSALAVALGCGPGEPGTGRESAGVEAAVSSPASEGAPRVEHLASEEFRALNLPFSEAVRVGDLLFLSGQIGTLPGELRLVEGGIGPETRQTLENIAGALERNGSSLERVIKCTAMLADIGEWQAMNEVYETFFPEGRLPARSAFGADGLALGARVEIECIAAVGGGRQ